VLEVVNDIHLPHLVHITSAAVTTNGRAFIDPSIDDIKADRRTIQVVGSVALQHPLLIVVCRVVQLSGEY